MGGKPIEGQEVMQTRTVTIYTGARIRVPEHIQRIDTHSTHGWQMRYGQPTLFFSDGQGPGVVRRRVSLGAWRTWGEQVRAARLGGAA